MAYEVNGIASSSPIGSVNNNLQWTIPYKSGQYPCSQPRLASDSALGAALLLQVADSLGNTGGVGGIPYNVTGEWSTLLQFITARSNTHVDGTSTNCHPSTETSDVTLSTDVTALTTCDPLVLNLGGGQTPYTVSLVATNSPVVTNVTLGAEDNQYTWINRGTPGDSLIGT